MHADVLPDRSIDRCGLQLFHVHVPANRCISIFTQEAVYACIFNMTQK